MEIIKEALKERGFNQLGSGHMSTVYEYTGVYDKIIVYFYSDGDMEVNLSQYNDEDEILFVCKNCKTMEDIDDLIRLFIK